MFLILLSLWSHEKPLKFIDMMHLLYYYFFKTYLCIVKSFSKPPLQSVGGMGISRMSLPSENGIGCPLKVSVPP